MPVKQIRIVHSSNKTFYFLNGKRTSKVQAETGLKSGKYVLALTTHIGSNNTV